MLFLLMPEQWENNLEQQIIPKHCPPAKQSGFGTQ